jgi:hypothetical protein
MLCTPIRIFLAASLDNALSKHMSMLLATMPKSKSRIGQASRLPCISDMLSLIASESASGL